MSDDANNSKNDDTSVSYYYDGTANVTDNSSTGTTASISNKTLSVEIKVLASATSNAEVTVSPWHFKYAITYDISGVSLNFLGTRETEASIVIKQGDNSILDISIEGSNSSNDTIYIIPGCTLSITIYAKGYNGSKVQLYVKYTKGTINNSYASMASGGTLTTLQETATTGTINRTGTITTKVPETELTKPEIIAEFVVSGSY